MGFCIHNVLLYVNMYLNGHVYYTSERDGKKNCIYVFCIIINIATSIL